jgi:hypothetical protein
MSRGVGGTSKQLCWGSGRFIIAAVKTFNIHTSYGAIQFHVYVTSIILTYIATDTTTSIDRSINPTKETQKRMTDCTVHLFSLAPEHPPNNIVSQLEQVLITSIPHGWVHERLSKPFLRLITDHSASTNQHMNKSSRHTIQLPSNPSSNPSNCYSTKTNAQTH